MSCKIVNKKWGYEKWIENNTLYCGKHLHVLPDKWCSLHYHKNKKETFYVIKGEMILHHTNNMDIDVLYLNLLDITILKEGESFTIEPYTLHRFSSNLKIPCDFIEVSTHHDDEDSYRLIEAIG